MDLIHPGVHRRSTIQNELKLLWVKILLVSLLACMSLLFLMVLLVLPFLSSFFLSLFVLLFFTFVLFFLVFFLFLYFFFLSKLSCVDKGETWVASQKTQKPALVEALKGRNVVAIMGGLNDCFALTGIPDFILFFAS